MELSADDRLVDVVESGFDLVVRITRLLLAALVQYFAREGWELTG